MFTLVVTTNNVMSRGRFACVSCMLVAWAYLEGAVESRPPPIAQKILPFYHDGGSTGGTSLGSGENAGRIYPV